MSYLSEMTLIGGLFMISIGTYLGGVWANESWGRYWGWDAKETWALVTILVYAFILHMRLIPKPVSYTHLRAHETVLDLVCRLLLDKKKNA